MNGQLYIYGDGAIPCSDISFEIDDSIHESKQQKEERKALKSFYRRRS